MQKLTLAAENARLCCRRFHPPVGLDVARRWDGLVEAPLAGKSLLKKSLVPVHNRVVLELVSQSVQVIIVLEKCTSLVWGYEPTRVRYNTPQHSVHPP